jgi:hypothetical protein
MTSITIEGANLRAGVDRLCCPDTDTWGLAAGAMRGLIHAARTGVA